jgi:hypothetical protein
MPIRGLYVSLVGEYLMRLRCVSAKVCYRKYAIICGLVGPHCVDLLLFSSVRILFISEDLGDSCCGNFWVASLVRGGGAIKLMSPNWFSQLLKIHAASARVLLGV